MNDDQLLNEALRITGIAEEKGIILRLMGACAVRVHSPSLAGIHERMRGLTDLDFGTYSKWDKHVPELFAQLGYHTRPMLYFISHGRHTLFSEASGIHVDIFTDRLRMNHTIQFKNRLEVDRPTIPLAELLLEKLQIVQINEKDIVDIAILLAEHSVGHDDNDKINASYVAQLLCQDWEFSYTVTLNLGKTLDMLDEYAGVLGGDNVRTTRERITHLLDYINSRPKSLAWKMRAKIGTRKKWYEDVDALTR